MAKIKIEIDEKRKFTLDFDDLKIDEANLDQLLCDQPGSYGRYARIAGMAKAKVERIEYQLEELEANLDSAIRDAKKKKEPEEKMTEGRIKQMIISNTTRLAMVNQLMDAKEQYEIAAAARDASAQKKD